MKYDHEGPAGAKFGAGSCVVQAVRWEDREAVERWFGALLEAMKDLRGAARDRARCKQKRVLSRAEARRQIDASSEQLFCLVEAGAKGFGVSPHGPDPLQALREGGGGEDAPPVSGKRPRSTPPDEAG